MKGEGREREKSKPRKEKSRVSEGKKLTERRKISSDGLFMLERDLSLDRSLTEPRIYVPEILIAKVKRNINSIK